MLIDTDVLIWYFRGNEKAKILLDKLGPFSISAVVYIELLQGAHNKTELQKLKNFIKAREVKILTIDEMITLKALFFIETYALSHGLRLADALIAATADVYNETLLTGNVSHYRVLATINLKHFIAH